MSESNTPTSEEFCKVMKDFITDHFNNISRALWYIRSWVSRYT